MRSLQSCVFWTVRELDFCIGVRNLGRMPHNTCTYTLLNAHALKRWFPIICPLLHSFLVFIDCRFLSILSLTIDLISYRGIQSIRGRCVLYNCYFACLFNWLTCLYYSHVQVGGGKSEDTKMLRFCGLATWCKILYLFQIQNICIFVSKTPKIKRNVGKYLEVWTRHHRNLCS